MAEETHVTEAAHGAVEGAAHGAEHGADHAAGAFPPFDFELFSHQIFWFLVAFGLLYWAMSSFVLPRAGAVIGKRESTLKGDRDAASRAASSAEKRREEAEKAAAQARAEARALIDDVRAKAAAELAEEQAKADAAIAEKIAAAEVRIGDMRAKAMGEVHTIAQDVARDITSKLAPKAA